MKNKIRKLNEEDNPLFELIQYKIDINFISDRQNQPLLDKFKKIILSEFRHVSCEINKKQKTFYFQYKLKSQENWLPNYSLGLLNEPNIKIKILLLNENEDKQKYVTSHLNELADSKNQSLIPYTRLFILNNKHYENYVQSVKNKLPIDKNEVGVIYCPVKEPGFKYIYKFTLIQIVQAINDYGKKQFEIIKSKDKETKHLSKEVIFKRIEEGIIHHDFKYVINLCNYFEYSLNWIPEISVIKEINGIVNFYIDYYYSENNDDFSSNRDVINSLEEAADSYRKKKDFCKECECLLRLYVYYSYFIGSEPKSEKYIEKILASSKNAPYEFQVMLHLQLIWLYQQRNNRRKQNFNNYIGITVCQNNNEEIKNTLNIFLRFLKKNFPIYDIYNKKIQNLEIFNDIHRKIIRKGWKNSVFQIKEQDDQGKIILKEVSRRKIVKGTKLYISKYDKDVNFFDYNLIWFNVQECIYRNIINYCINNKEMLFGIIYYMSYLQSLENDLSENKQNEIIKELFENNALSISKKINLSLYKIPMLIRINPICSNIKFEITKNEKLPKKKTLFLYNPWKKSSTINYFWSKNSYQYITIEFKNILKIPITLNNIIILFERKKIDKDQNKHNETNEEEKNKVDENFNKGKLPICFPTSVTIPPNEKALVVEKIKMLDEVIFDIVGIKYDIFNFTT